MVAGVTTVWSETGAAMVRRCEKCGTTWIVDLASCPVCSGGEAAGGRGKGGFVFSALEQGILEVLAEAGDLFGETFPRTDDEQEFRAAIHAARNIVLARAAARALEEEGSNGEGRCAGDGGVCCGDTGSWTA